MTSKATLGEFLRAAERHLDQALADLIANRPATSADAETLIRDAAAGLQRLVAAVRQYDRDRTPERWQVPENDRQLMTPWSRAQIQAREAIELSATFLRLASLQPADTPTEPGPFRQRLEAAARALSTGHDLLDTHYRTGIDGLRQGQTEWAAVIDSTPVSRALQAEILPLTALIGARCARLAQADGTPGTYATRRRLSAACHQLLTASTAIHTADQADPVPDYARELLHAIPVNAQPDRPARHGGESLTDICHNIIDSAERTRRASHALAREAAWSPAVSGTALRHAAAACAATSHHCQLLLTSLATQHNPDGQLRTQLLNSAAAADHTRATWFATAHAWDQMTTDAPKTISRAAAEAADLAYWTGRLTFADPAWTLTRGPSSTQRSPQNLTASPDTMRSVVAAIHHACHTLTWLAEADFRQVKTAGQAGRLLVPTSTLDDHYDIPHLFHRAPAHRSGAALAAYRDAATTSRTATTTMDHLATTTRAPSHLLTLARTAITASDADAQHMITTSGVSAPSAQQTQITSAEYPPLAPHSSPTPGAQPSANAASRARELDAGDGYGPAQQPHELAARKPDNLAARRKIRAPSAFPARKFEIPPPVARQQGERELEP